MMKIKKSKTQKTWARRSAGMLTAAMLTALVGSPAAMAQTGVDDDRVNLPDGPGSIEGVGDNVEIDPNMGAMSWSVPIALPRGHVTPEVGVSYSSAAGNGPLGVGWSMPSPTIERMTSRGVPRYTTEDYIAADGGTELVLVDDSDPDALVYRERFEKSFKRYTWIEGGAQGYWKVEMPDGSVAYYGANEDGMLDDTARAGEDSLGTFRYHLVARVDAWGHVARYHYENFDSNHPLLTRIDYLFVDSSPQYSIKMSYGERDDDISDANCGYEDLLTRRLERIDVVSGEQVIRAYQLEYEPYEDSGGVTRMSRVSRYGLDGVGEAYPVDFRFEYSKALGAECDSVLVDCSKPRMYSAGKVPGASNFQSGKATLVDFNGDSLPDVLDTSQDGAHQIFLAKLTPDATGGFDHSFEDGVESAHGQGANFRLGDGGTQILDVDGDGRSDLLNPTSASWLRNDPDGADWQSVQTLSGLGVLTGLDFSQARFLDYDNDRRIDFVTSSGASTTVYANTKDGFDVTNVESVGASFEDSQLVQFADMNGDGQQDVVQLLSEGTVLYKLNLGRGNWSPNWIEVTGVALDPGDHLKVDLEDLNGDGLSDMVLVSSTELRYAINRNGEQFTDWVPITTDRVEGTLPVRDEFTSVLYADMNANGSEDIVWLTANGDVDYLELFPVRPNLLSRIDNGLGAIQKITYGSAVSHMARAEATDSPWTRALSMATMVVDEVDLFVTLTGSEDGSGLHEITRYSYANGFYDGDEKQYRGFESVESTVDGGAQQETGGTTWLFDVGASAPWRSGLSMALHTYSDDRLLSVARSTYEACELEGVPSPAQLQADGRFGIYHPCITRQEIERVEGSPDEAVTTAIDYEYDGYGQVTLETQWGVVDVEGDERFSSTQYADPTTRWQLGLVSVEQTWEREDGAQKTEDRYYYDGEDFEGSQTGIFDRGFLTRHERRVDADTFIPVTRRRPDEHGNPAEEIGPNGSVEEPDAHRRLYTYDDAGVFLEQIDVKLKDESGEPYTLRQETSYHPLFQTMATRSEWMVVRDDVPQTPSSETSFDYDTYGRLNQVWRPGDASEDPSERYTYEMTDTFSRVAVELASEDNAQPIMAQECLDGRGRKYQTRKQLSSGKYFVSGFSEFNARGTVVRSYESYTSDSPDCEAQPPEGVAYIDYLLDGQGRVLGTSNPSERVHGERSTTRVVYGPLSTSIYDEEDTFEAGESFDTPTIERLDGLGRVIAIERTSKDESGQVARSTTTLHYDETGSFAGYTDAQGMRHEQVVDLAGRITRLGNPNSGDVTLEYDAAGNEIARTDARGITLRTEYDGNGRILAQWNDADKEGSVIRYIYDIAPEDCEEVCTHVAGQLAGIDYPLPQDTAWGEIGHGSDRFGYDERRRDTIKSRRFGSMVELTSSYTYDRLDRLVSITHPNAERVDYHYDGAGRLTGVPGKIDEMHYDSRGLLAGLDYANGARVEMSYDDQRRLRSRVHYDALDAVIHGEQIEHDRMGHITSSKDMTLPDELTTQYTYDAWHRLTQAQMPEVADFAPQPVSLGVSYDEVDRVVSKAIEGELVTMSYDDTKPGQLTKMGDVAMSYDASGHLTGRGDVELGWDHYGRITDVSRGQESLTRSVYGAGPARIARTGVSSHALHGFDGFEVRDGVAMNYVRVNQQRLTRSEDPSFATTLYVDADEDGEITAFDAFAVHEQEGAQVGALLGAAAARMLADDEPVALHLDRLGSVVAATDAGGELVGKRLYHPFGSVRAEQGFVDFYGFTGQEHDANAPLIYFEWRALDPEAGRWMSVDPMFMEVDEEKMRKLGEATTSYAYVRNNPTSFIDPNGLLTSQQMRQQAIELKEKAEAAQAKVDKINNYQNSTNPNQKERLGIVRSLFGKGDRQKIGEGKNPVFLNTRLNKMKQKYSTQSAVSYQKARALEIRADHLDAKNKREGKRIKPFIPKRSRKKNAFQKMAAKIGKK